MTNLENRRGYFAAKKRSVREPECGFQNDVD